MAAFFLLVSTYQVTQPHSAAETLISSFDMPRRRKVRQSKYRQYFEKDRDNAEIPESTIRSQNKDEVVRVKVLLQVSL